MHLDERLGRMHAEPRAQTRSGHGVPLVAHAAGVEAEREVVTGRHARRRRLGRDEARLAVRRVEAALGEEAPVRLALAPRLAGAQRPLHGIERGKGVVGHIDLDGGHTKASSDGLLVIHDLEQAGRCRDDSMSRVATGCKRIW